MEYKQQINQKILNTNYSDKVKKKLIEKIDLFNLITEQMFMKICENLEKYLEDIKIKLEIFDKFKLEVVKLERHQYAPEMNKLHFKSGKSYSAPHKTDINSALRYVLDNYRL